MISTHVMQDIFSNHKDWAGFAIKSTGGCIRVLEYKLLREGIKVTANDIVDTLKYMLSRGWVRESGLWGRDRLYSLEENDANDRL